MAGHIDVALKILRSSSEESRHISLTVSDSGVGISPEFLKYHLFTPFMQENILIPGTGLGLSIVKSIVESMGGKIFVESRLGEGTRITVAAPLREDCEGPVEPQSDEGFLPHNKLYGLSLGMVSLASDSSDSAPKAHIVPTPELLRRCVLNICEGRFGMVYVDATDNTFPKVDVLLINTYGLTTSDHVDVTSLFPMDTKPLDVPAILLIGAPLLQVANFPRSLANLTSPITSKRVWATLVSALDGAQSTAPLPMPLIEDTSHSLAARSSRGKSSHKDSSENYVSCNKSISPNETPTQVTGPTPSTPPCRFTRFLLVDDNRINLKVLVAFAKRLGVSYSTAADGAEAVRLYEHAFLEDEQPYDCALMDLSMPVMNGFEAVAAIRRIECGNEIGVGKGKGKKRAYILALTGLGSEGARKEAMAVGCDRFLLKPVKFKDVVPLLGVGE
jgi:CheY-like chemotaxis protein